MGLRLALACATVTATLGIGNAGTVVPVGHFTRISLEDGGHVRLRHGATQSVTLIKGSTEFTRFTLEGSRNLKIENCHRHCPSNYEMEVEIVSPDIDALAVSDGGKIVAEGIFPGRPQINVAVANGGSLDARALAADRVNAAVVDGGAIKVTSRSELNAAVTEGGLIRYWGNPKVRRAVIDGGAIERAED